MKNHFVLIFLFVGILGWAQQSTKAFQQELQEEYRNLETSPLKGEEWDEFHGLTFFQINNKYIIKAKYKLLEKGDIVKFPTSSGQVKTYKKYALVSFKLDQKELQLYVYQSFPVLENYTNHLFLPFTDQTSGTTSYGGGRYLDLSIDDFQQSSKEVVLDFNKTYNPYCAYSKYYSCPIPPAENFLDVEINAGVSYGNNKH